MTRDSAQRGLVTANDQLLERRRFMEAVLSGISAGVIQAGRAGSHHALVGRAAETLLGLAEADLDDRKLGEALPVFNALLEKRDSRACARRALRTR